MNSRLEPGQHFKTDFRGCDVLIESLIRDDPTGELYRITCDGHPAALKVYSKAFATRERRAAITDLIDAGPPDQNFLWPLEMLWVDPSKTEDFGYTLALPDSSLQSLDNYKFSLTCDGFKKAILACLSLARSFGNLHSHGYCFISLRLKNLLLDPNSSQITILDNDNITIDGSQKEGPLRPSKYSAPEIIQAKSVPSIRTDLHLLASVVFYLLFGNHPMDGAMAFAGKATGAPPPELYGENALFVFHPRDQRNAPVQGVQDKMIFLWKIYPKYIGDMFLTLFIEGLKNQSKRISVGAWRTQLIRLHDSIFDCQNCHQPNFYEIDGKEQKGLQRKTCWNCSTQYKLPPRIKIGELIILLTNTTKLFPYHTHSRENSSFTVPTASMTRLPSDPQHFGLRNDGSSPWTCSDGRGNTQSVAPGKVLPLLSGSIIDFGARQGEIRA